jgi:uncharacterized protein YcfJ
MKFNLKSPLKAILSLLLFSALSTSAQEGQWQSKMVDPNTNIYEVKESFETFWANKQVTKGKGYKQYKRWEWFMEQRCFPTGVRFAPDAIYVAMQEQPEMFMFNENMPGSWSYIGNTSVPTGGGGAGRVNSVRHLPGSTTTFFACAPGGGLWKTTNSGVSWTMMNTDNLASIGVSDVAIDPNDTDVMYIATGDGDAGDTYSLGVLKTTDGGLTWNTTGLNWAVTNQRTTNRILIDPSNSQNVIAATSNGIYRTTNGGTSWTQVQSGSFKDLKFHPTNASIVYASSDSFYKSTDGGATWTNITSGLPSASNVSRMALAVSVDEPTWVYILAGANDNGFYGVYKSTNSGTTFTQPYTGSLNLMGWDPSGTDSGGQAWYDLALEADPSDANVIYTGGVNVWKSSNGGTSWALNGHWYGGGGVPYVHADVHALHFVPGTSRLLVGCDGGVFTTLNGGTAYSDISSNLQIAQQYRLSVSAANVDIVLSGWQDNGTNLKNGSTFTRPIGGDGMDCQINPTNGSIMYGELYYGDIYKSTNTGVNFGTNICSSGGTGVDEDGAWVTPFVLGSENADHVYVGKTRVYKSTNGGSTWTSLAAIGSGTINALHVATAENDYIYASKGGTLYVSTNNGASFTTSSGLPGGSITSIVTSTTNAQQVYVTISGFSAGQKVYMSTNAGSTWTNISGSLPNIPANSIVYQNGADNSIYVGTDAGVYYRDDVLGNWVPYMNGMPNVVVTDLDINYSANKIVASTYGRGLWSAPLYALPQLDAAITGFTSPSSTLCETEVNAAFDILNAGEDNLTSISIEYQINGGAVQTYNWTGTLVSGGAVSINIPTFDLGTGSFSISASIVDVNGQGLDENSLNDNGSVSYYVTGGTNNLTLTLLTDCYAEETSWEILQGSTVIFSGGGYVNNTEYTIPICIGDGCFTLNVNDSYGDGLASCSGGDFTLVNDANSAVLAQMTSANFGEQSSHNFCINVPTPGCTDISACNYNASATTDDGTCTYGPTNDHCSGALSLTVNGGNTLVNNTNTCSNAANPGCGGNTQILDMWYSFVYTGGDITITTSTGTASGIPSLTDTRIALYDACDGTMMLCDDDISTSNYFSQIVLPCSEFVQGQTYYIQAGGYNGTSGVFTINVTASTVNGCTDIDATNYDACANTDDGSCIYSNGCTDPSACNYDDLALVDDGSCFYASTYYLDQDNDGYGNLAMTVQGCSAPFGYVSNSTDCNDNNNAVYPNATEVCNTIDDDCDSAIDEGLLSTFYLDQDNDGYGNLEMTVQGCSAPVGYVSNSTDCNDNNNAVYPNATEECNTIDDDCDSAIDEGLLSTFYLDQDNDGYGNLAMTVQGCSAPVGYVSNSTDCNDNNNAVYPNSTEVCNTIDDDCDSAIDEGLLSTFYLDQDNDGYGNLAMSVQGCSAPVGYVSNSIDCNDNNNTVNPLATESCSNSVDDDCDGQINEGCTPPPSSVVNDLAVSATVISPSLYPNCSNITGNLTSATPSAECTVTYAPGAGQDVWYRFVAGSTGLRIHASSSANDIALQLFDASLNPIVDENVMSFSQNEILNIGSLNQGVQYYLCVRNISTSSVGSFTICIQNLETSHPDYGPNFSGACAKWKSNWTGCSLYTVTITDGAFIGSYSSSSTIFNLNAIPGIQYNHAYNVNITSTYSLVNGAGVLEPISTVGGPFAIFINQHQDMDLRTTDRCPVNRAIGAFIASDISLCGHLEYEWEFLQVDPTDQITMGLPVYAETNSTSRFIRTSSIPGVMPSNVYRVKIRPLFSYGAGDFGADYQLLCISAPAGISEESTEFNYLRQSKEESIKSALYPNPNDGQFVLINVDGLQNESIDISIVDMLGRTLDRSSYVVKRDGSTIRVDFKNQLTSGQYLIKMNIEGDEIIEKMMVH